MRRIERIKAQEPEWKTVAAILWYFSKRGGAVAEVPIVKAGEIRGYADVVAIAPSEFEDGQDDIMIIEAKGDGTMTKVLEALRQIQFYMHHGEEIQRHLRNAGMIKGYGRVLGAVAMHRELSISERRLLLTSGVGWIETGVVSGGLKVPDLAVDPNFMVIRPSWWKPRMVVGRQEASHVSNAYIRLCRSRAELEELKANG